MKILKNAKALSPVVASIILIAVTVAVSIAVAAWMGALSFNFMNTEQLTFTSYTWGTPSPATIFNFTVKNTGATSLTLTDVRIDGDAAASACYKSTDLWINFTSGTTVPIAKGDSVQFGVTRTGGNFTSGIQYEFTVITAKGNIFGPYIKSAP
jgi:flagellin-like protein